MLYTSPTGLKFNFDDKLKENLDILLNGVLNYRQDAIIVIDGEEGSGKTQASHQLALYCAETLGTVFERDGTKNVHSSMEKYIHVAEGMHKQGVRGFVNVLDESRSVLGKAHHSTKEVKRFTDWLSECREMGQVHIILLPAFHDLQKYVVLWRMSFLIHMVKEFNRNEKALGGYDLRLGGFKAYANDDALKQAYINPYWYPKQWSARSRFDNVEVMTEKGIAALREQKDTERERRVTKDQESGIDKNAVWLNGLIAVLHTEGHEMAPIARLFGITRQAIHARIQSGKSTRIYTEWARRARGETGER